MTANSFSRPENCSINFPIDYKSILARVNEINPTEYGKTRNFIDGAVTYLSPYISRGIISSKQVQETVLSKGHDPAIIMKFLQELAWREYFQRVWQAKVGNLFTDLNQPQHNVFHHKMIEAIQNAATGITAIDNSIIAFYETGYLHNHVRMYIASIACNVGKAHWSAPARWMYYHLLDGDLGSNTCSWQWVSGVLSSKKYFCNQENINRYTHSQQAETFLDTAIENLPQAFVPGALKATIDLNLKALLPNVAKPAIDTAKPTLIYNSYNLDPQWRQSENVNRILLFEPSHFQQFPVDEKVIKFILLLSRNIPDCRVMVGEASELKELYRNSSMGENGLISKEHPAFTHYPGVKDERDWIYPEVNGYYNSFFSYWKQCEKLIRKRI